MPGTKVLKEVQSYLQSFCFLKKKQKGIQKMLFVPNFIWFFFLFTKARMIPVLLVWLWHGLISILHCTLKLLQAAYHSKLILVLDFIRIKVFVCDFVLCFVCLSNRWLSLNSQLPVICFNDKINIIFTLHSTTSFF